jgi:hypothetical protein
MACMYACAARSPDVLLPGVLFTLAVLPTLLVLYQNHGTHDDCSLSDVNKHLCAT